MKDGIPQLADKGWLTKLERPGKSSVFTVEHSGGSSTRPPGGRSGDQEGVVQATPNYTNELHQGSVSKKCVDCGKPADINPFTGEPNPRCRSVTAHTKNRSKIHDSKRLHTVFGNQRRLLMTRLMLELRWQTSVDASRAFLTASWTKKSNQYPTTADRLSQALSAPLTAKGTVCD